MNVDVKIKQFSDVVLREAEMHRDSVLSRITEEYEKTTSEYEKTAKEKFDRRFEEERNRANREEQKDIVLAQAELKKQLIAKRTQQIEHIIFNVSKRIDEYIETPEYLNSLIADINANKSSEFTSVVYLTEKDMKHEEAIEAATGIKVVQSMDDFIGGFKITLGNNRIADCCFKTRLEEEKEMFNKIKIS